MNGAYRSAKNRRDGRPDEAHLDAAESLPHLLWDADRLLLRLRLRRVLADGDPGTQRDLT